jgi:predicted nucleic acid-binding protein
VSSGRFLDTKILVYAHQEGDDRTPIARQILFEGGVIGVQVLNEFASVLRAKLGFPWPKVQEAVNNILVLCPNPRPLSVDTHMHALGLSERFGFPIWDGLIVAAAIEARCPTLLTEDLPHGQVVEGVRILNPFLGRAKP